MDRSHIHHQNPTTAMRNVAKQCERDQHRNLRRKGFEWVNSV